MIYKLKKSAVYFLVTFLMLLAISVTISAYNGYFEPLCFFGFCGTWVLVWFIIFIAIAIWVYKDAERRGKSGALWLIVVILLGLIGIIIWLIVRPPIGGEPRQPTTSSGRMCPSCGRPIPMDARLCPYCGRKFE
jgi:hypothetical protein